MSMGGRKPSVAGCIGVGAGLDGAPVIASRYDDRVDAVHHSLFKKKKLSVNYYSYLDHFRNPRTRRRRRRRRRTPKRAVDGID